MKNIRFFLLTLITTALLFSCSSTPVTLQTDSQTKLTLNSKVPEISAIGIGGHPQTIKGLSKSKGLILVLYRSAEWCPFCIEQLEEYNEWSEKFESLGYGLAAISYDDMSVLREFTEDNDINYSLISDQNYQTFKSFGVLNQDYQPDDDIYGIPYPGVLVIDSSQKLIHKYFYEGYRNRPKAEDVYNQLK